jgi:biopolymer transport protein ExbD
MGMSVGGSNRGIFVEMNVVPLIDVLLVLLVIFMIIPHKQKGLMAELPQPAPPDRRVDPQPSVIVVQVLADGTLRINQEAVNWDGLGARLEQIFGSRANLTAFIAEMVLWSFRSSPGSWTLCVPQVYRRLGL